MAARSVTSSPLLIITGLSGSGKSTAVNSLEDLGYYCVDNLPIPLLEPFLQTTDADGNRQKIAVVIDIRNRDYINSLPQQIRQLRQQGYPINILFLQADQEVLIQRYNVTRRLHPVSKNLREAVRKERILMAKLSEIADKIIDTSGMNVHQLGQHIKQFYSTSPAQDRLNIMVSSFGFKYGSPPGLDLMFDARFLPNPYFVEELREKNGEQKEIKAFLAKHDIVGNFIQRLLDFILYLLPHYEKEGKKYLNIGIGCTGGKHRSVYIARKLFTQLKESYGSTLSLSQRDIKKG